MSNCIECSNYRTSAIPLMTGCKKGHPTRPTAAHKGNPSRVQPDKYGKYTVLAPCSDRTLR